MGTNTNFSKKNFALEPKTLPLAPHWHSIGIPLASHWHSTGIPLASH